MHYEDYEDRPEYCVPRAKIKGVRHKTVGNQAMIIMYGYFLEQIEKLNEIIIFSDMMFFIYQLVSL